MKMPQKETLKLFYNLLITVFIAKVLCTGSVDNWQKWADHQILNDIICYLGIMFYIYISFVVAFDQSYPFKFEELLKYKDEIEKTIIDCRYKNHNYFDES